MNGKCVNYVDCKISIANSENARFDVAIRVMRAKFAKKSIVNIKQVENDKCYTYYWLTFPDASYAFEFGRLFGEIKKWSRGQLKLYGV